MDEDVLKQLAPLREGIDALDASILDLMTQRARLALQVGEVKHRAGGSDATVLRPEREAQVIRRLQERNQGPLSASTISAVWTEIISACRGLEKGLTVAYLGPAGTYSEHAALAHFGHAITTLPCATFDEIFRAVEAKQADVGIVPIENSTEGAVNRTLDLLLTSPLRIIGESSLLVRHCLLTQSGTLDGVARIMAHPQALAQCQGWLTQHAASLPREVASSNAEAARLASLDPTIAAIASESTAQDWNLRICAAGIQDDPHNRTRFVAIGHDETLPSGRDKTSLILAVPNRAGAVMQMLMPLSQNGVSMTRFESRPARTGQWEYYFYVDIEGHRTDTAVAQALQELQAQTAFLKMLGSYPTEP